MVDPIVIADRDRELAAKADATHAMNALTAKDLLARLFALRYAEGVRAGRGETPPADVPDADAT